MKEILILLKKLSVFIPLGIALLIFPIALLFFSGEFKDIDKVIKIQNQKESRILFGRKYYSDTFYYKLKGAEVRSAKVLALGTSRVMAFRSRFFKNEISFFNGGGGVRKMSQFASLLKELPKSSLPEVLIVAFDQHFFNPNWAGQDKFSDFQKTYSKKTFAETWNWGRLYLLNDILFNTSFSLKTALFNIHNDNLIGLNAKSFNVGYLNDGSWYYGQIAQTLHSEYDEGFEPTIKKIIHGQEDWEHASSIRQESLKELEELLIFCKDNNIHLVSFLPPFAKKVVDAFKEKGELQSYLFKIPAAIQPLYDSYGFKFFDFTDLSTITDDKETFDGYHGSEVAYARLLLRMAKEDSLLANYIDQSFLREKLEKVESPYFLIGTDEF